MLKANKSLLVTLAVVLTAGCASQPQVVVDPKSIKSEASYQRDMAECHTIARNYDLSDQTTKNALLGAAGGGVVVAGGVWSHSRGTHQIGRNRGTRDPSSLPEGQRLHHVRPQLNLSLSVQYGSKEGT